MNDLKRFDDLDSFSVEERAAFRQWSKEQPDEPFDSASSPKEESALARVELQQNVEAFRVAAVAPVDRTIDAIRPEHRNAHPEQVAAYRRWLLKDASKLQSRLALPFGNFVRRIGDVSKELADQRASTHYKSLSPAAIDWFEHAVQRPERLADLMEIGPQPTIDVTTREGARDFEARVAKLQAALEAQRTAAR